MHALIVLSHPESKSANGAMACVADDTLKSMGYSVEISDLYAEGFDPVERPGFYTNRKNPDFFAVENEQRHAHETDTLPSDILRELSRLDRADVVMFQFPLWNHGVPAILKGWFDRVFVYGRIYKSTMRHDSGYFRGKRAICSVTAGASAPAFTPYALAGDINWLMYPIHRELYYMGFSVLPPFFAHGIHHGRPGKEDDHGDPLVKNHLAALATRLKGIADEEPIAFPRRDEWEHGGHLKDPSWPIENCSKILETSSVPQFGAHKSRL